MTESPAKSELAALTAMQRCTCFNLRKATRAVTQLYDEFMRPTGLRVTQFSLLAAIRIAGKISITELAQEAVMDRTTLKRNLELLEREGFVRIQPGDDARVREVSLTAAAQRKLAAALPYWTRAQNHVTGKLGQARSDQLLSNLAAAIGAAHPESRDAGRGLADLTSEGAPS
jgi:DNA-binding MarR family transcriptional regulator